MAITITNTKSSGRRMAKQMIRDGASVENLRDAARLLKNLMLCDAHNRHVIAGFCEAVDRYERRMKVAMNVRQYAVRLKHDSGTHTVVTAATDAPTAMRMVLAAEGAPERSVVWVAEQPVCDYCVQPATRRVRDSHEVVCGKCARAQTDGPVREYVLSLSVTQWPRVAVS
jgi:hypothetical protein